MSDAPYYTGDDTREELTEPDPPDCPECGAKHDEPCTADCGCVYCRRRKALQQERGDTV